jgi:hypothetical protein
MTSRPQILVRVVALLCLVCGAFLFDDTLRFYFRETFTRPAAFRVIGEGLVAILIMIGAGGALCLRRWGRVLLLVSLVAQVAMNVRWLVIAGKVMLRGGITPQTYVYGILLSMFWLMAAVLLVVMGKAFPQGKRS